MRTLIPVLALIAAVVFLAMGSTQVTAADMGHKMSSETMSMCSLRFDSMDLGSKGYLTERDLEESYYGRTSPTTYAKAASKFGRMDVNEDGRVTPHEYCTFK
jgi:hypothetical protein